MTTSAKSFFVAFGLDKSKDEAPSFFRSEDIDAVQIWIANGGRRTTPAAPQNEPNRDQDDLNEQDLPRGFRFHKLTSKLIGSMSRLNSVMSATMTMLPRLEINRLNRALYYPLRQSNKLTSKIDSFEVYECNFDQIKLFNSVGRQLNQLKEGRASLPGMFLMGLISSYDAFLSELMRLIFLTKPEMLSASEKNISFKDLVELGSIDAARNHIIDKEVETFLRQSHHAQFDILESRLGIPLRQDLKIWSKFVEICERRNLFTHTDGIVSRQYLQVCTEHKVSLESVVIGQQLKLPAKYLREAVDVVTELGWKLTQVNLEKTSSR